ncbi:hypothetical protein EVAR_40983_1 [Eumeta japonica]|uniref:UBZ4-type domain-containing protein n=1 Tax=Eumeta variegata TaxID=151549 RepID=A0A4C1XIG8_EUMVA|nr:hypothetical protein EVAR_40983_1 [Eumeta japonica]
MGTVTRNRGRAKKRRNEAPPPPYDYDMTRAGTPPPALYACPVCGLKMRSIKLIQEHIDQCLNDDCAIV